MYINYIIKKNEEIIKEMVIMFFNNVEQARKVIKLEKWINPTPRLDYV